MKPGGMNELRMAGRAASVIFFQVTVSLRFNDTQGWPDVFWELRFVLVRRRSRFFSGRGDETALGEREKCTAIGERIIVFVE
jgi:hypothetical protein